MVKLTHEEQAAVHQIFSKIYAGLPPEAQAQINQIRAEGLQEMEDRNAELDVRINQLKSARCRLVPIAELAWSAAFAAHRAEPLESRRDLAATESGRAFIRAIKAALLDGSLIAREQGSGIPVNDRSWCLENDTLLSLQKMMPHDRLMLRTDEAKAWIEKMGIAIDAFPILQLATHGVIAARHPPSQTEFSGSKVKRRKDFITDALEEAFKAIPGGETRDLWRWIVSNITRWPELTHDGSRGTLREGTKKPTDLQAFEARVRRQKKFRVDNAKPTISRRLADD